MTPPRTLGVWKSLEDIKADFALDMKERKKGRFTDAAVALRGVHGMSLADAYALTIRWSWELHDATQSAVPLLLDIMEVVTSDKP